MIRILLADDQPLVRVGLRAMLDEDDIEVVAEAATGHEAVRLAIEHRPDIVLMDIRMPGLDGIAATRGIVAEHRLSQVRVVILTTYDLDEYVYQALRSGASGFALKDAEPVALLTGLRAVARGEALLAPTVTHRLIAEFTARSRTPPQPLDLRHLTDREEQVLRLVVSGRSNDEIAERLAISPATAKTHISRILAKLDARDRAQLVVQAYESGSSAPTGSPDQPSVTQSSEPPRWPANPRERWDSAGPAGRRTETGVADAQRTGERGEAVIEDQCGPSWSV
ncbi:response regulator [Actinoallomurus sp. CA-142502]|uniref:response regulator n=1 Tax=Actinoallomurus sp. CA-142502 TaxID=3239885 RepID=UPI003D8F48BF